LSAPRDTVPCFIMASTAKNFALISVSDKRGVVQFAAGLVERGYRVLASGGTATALEAAGMQVTKVSEVTNTPHMLGGRVKTLHPRIHAAILAKGDQDHMGELGEHGITPIDVVVCNLYPFANTVAKEGVTWDDAIENIDIGGVALLRAAAKNCARVVTVTNPDDYDAILKQMAAGGVTEEKRKALALKAFIHTSDYDTHITSYIAQQQGSTEQHMTLRYGMNPHQKPAIAYTPDSKLPFEVLCGSPGYINLLDALNAWQLVAELRASLNLPAAASFKHVSPAGAAVALPLDETEAKVYMVEDASALSPLASAYCRARGADRMSSFGDFIALSDECDESTARVISREVSDGVIAPGYSAEALSILSQKKAGKYCVLKMDAAYRPGPTEQRSVFGVTLTQKRNDMTFTEADFAHEKVPAWAARDLAVASAAVKFAQSNSVCFAARGQVVGLGAGQQSRVHCVRLAGGKADNWWLRHHPKVLNLKFKKGVKRAEKANLIDNYVLGYLDVTTTGDLLEEQPLPFTEAEVKEWLASLKGVSLSSDAFFPFRDNIDRAAQSGVAYIAVPTGSQNDAVVAAACDEYGIVMLPAKARLFHH